MYYWAKLIIQAVFYHLSILYTICISLLGTVMNSKWHKNGKFDVYNGESMGNHFYHIKWPPLNVTIFIKHVHNLRNESYANVMT